MEQQLNTDVIAFFMSLFLIGIPFMVFVLLVLFYSEGNSAWTESVENNIIYISPSLCLENNKEEGYRTKGRAVIIIFYKTVFLFGTKGKG